MDYLKKYTPVERQTFEQQKEFLKEIEKFQLTLNEKSQILNFPPQGLVEVHLVSRNRFGKKKKKN